MNATWLIDADCEGSRSEELQAELRRQGQACRAVKGFVQFPAPSDIAGAEAIPIDSRVIFIGGPTLMRHIQASRRWKPGGWCTFANFACDVYYAYFGQYLLNKTYALLPASEVLRQSRQLMEQFGVVGELFIRPAPGRKLFTGKVVDAEALPKALSQLFDPRTLIVVSSPKSIAREWRLYIANNQIVAWSQYANGGASEILPHCPDEVRDYGATVLSRVAWRPDPLFTMDICESQGALHLLELNGFSCSNLYAADLGEIVRAASLAAKYA